MKKLLTFLALQLTALSVFSQIPKPQTLENFSTWSVTPYIAFSYENMDRERNDLFYTKTPLNRGLGFEVTKQLSHYFSLQANVFKTSAKHEETRFAFESDLTQADIRVRLNLTNGAIFQRWQSTQLYAFAGYGVLWYNSKQTLNLVGADPGNVVDQASVIPLGVGMKYRIGNRTSLSIDLSYNQTNTDWVDTWNNPLTSKDAYTKATIGFTYNLSKKKILEWDQPWAYLVPDVVHDTTVVIQKITYTPPPAIVKPKPDSVVIYYMPGFYQIEMPYLSELDTLLQRAQDEGLGVEIMAYCDSSGTQKGNYELVTKRADKVASYAEKFVPKLKVAIFRYDEGWAVYAPEARNRKVIVRVVNY